MSALHLVALIALWALFYRLLWAVDRFHERIADVSRETLEKSEEE